MVAHRTDTYSAVHRRLGRERGRAALFDCVDCGRRADTWSYARPDPVNERRDSRGLPYSLDLSRYDPRCKSCHSKLDGCGWFGTGAANPATKLTDADVLAARTARQAGESLYAIATRHGVSPSRIFQLTRDITSPNPRVH